MDIKPNTVDFTADVYQGPREWEYRWRVSTDPDFPETVMITYQETESASGAKEYISKDSLSFDKETWEKIKYAVESVFEKSI